jgi:DDE family transposase
MCSPPNIESDPLLFDKLLAPLEPLLSDFDHQPLSRAARKLAFALFVRLLLFRLFSQITSLRDLVLDLRTSSTATALGFVPLGLSTIHDAFSRYPVTWFAALLQYLLQSVVLVQLPELTALGQLWCVDSSLWPVVHQLSWLKEQGLHGVRLHLGLSLNTLCPTIFLLSYDKSPTANERRLVRRMIRRGVTYIMDRGYLDLELYLEVMAQGAFFIIRERNNLCYRTVAEMDQILDASFSFVKDVRDSVVKLRRDPQGVIFRVVHFTIAGHEFNLLTNRFDLSTQQVIMLYAWRWQVELIFRAWKHTLSQLHLINLSEAGIEIQFHLLLIASLLWATLQQQQQRVSATPAERLMGSVKEQKQKTITARLSRMFEVSWRLLRPALRLLRNCLAQSFSYYMKEVIEQRL